MLIAKDPNNNLIPVAVDVNGRVLVSDLPQTPTYPTARAVRVQHTFVASARAWVPVKTFDNLHHYRLRKTVLYIEDLTAGNIIIPYAKISGISCSLGNSYLSTTYTYYEWNTNLWVGDGWEIGIEFRAGVVGKIIELYAYWEEY